MAVTALRRITKEDGSWTFQRGPGHEMIEDLGNIDQMAFLVDYLFRAGATVVPLRPVGHQTNEVVLDNDDAGVTFEGDWSEPKNGPMYFGKAGARAVSPGRHLEERKPRTRVTRRRFRRPVFTRFTRGRVRAAIGRPDQLYRVHHPGGITEVTVNHRRVGNGLVYLGTYYFDAGTNGYVDISNRSNSEGSIVVADMIRFGNGMGDISRGRAGVSKLAAARTRRVCIG